jgi:oxygen-independent coproporphyrinogen-3 oxidase
MTEAAGLPAYEISNHAAPGEESRHNLLYWRYGEYAGVGPGAHGRLIVEGRRMATATERVPEAWAAQVETEGHGLAEIAPLSTAEAVDEALLMGLRLREGVDLRRIAELGSVRPAPCTLNELVALELVEPSEDTTRLRATRRGRFVLDAIITRLAANLEPIKCV